MGLNAVLVDQARIHSKASTGQRVEGTTVYEPTVSAWFRARLTLPQAPGSETPVAGVPEGISSPLMLCGVKDTTGKTIVINEQDRIEINSVQLGEALWDVVGEPEPLRKKRRVIGYQVSLRRVVVSGTRQL